LGLGVGGGGGGGVGGGGVWGGVVLGGGVCGLFLKNIWGKFFWGGLWGVWGLGGGGGGGCGGGGVCKRVGGNRETWTNNARARRKEESKRGPRLQKSRQKDISAAAGFSNGVRKKRTSA